MEFQRVGKHTVKCVISEEEIYDLGYSLEEIMSNGERTQEFMNYIFDMAEQEFQMKFDLGVKTVRADFLPDHTISLTFSEHPASGDMMEHLKDIVSGLLSSVPQEKWKELKEQAGGKAMSNSNEPDSDDVVQDKIKVIILLKFENLDTVSKFAKFVSLTEMPPNALYKYDNEYYVIIDLSDSSEDEVKKLSILTDEFAADIQVGAQRAAFIEEHGESILKSDAINILKDF